MALNDPGGVGEYRRQVSEGALERSRKQLENIEEDYLRRRPRQLRKWLRRVAWKVYRWA